MAQVGDSMMIPGDNGVPHLFVIIWGPGQIPSEASHDVGMLACVCSIDPLYSHDPACELNLGDHPFITHPSYVYYRKIRCDDPNHIDRMMASGMWPAKETASRALLRKMRTGVCNSRQVKRQYKFALGCPPPRPLP